MNQPTQHHGEEAFVELAMRHIILKAMHDELVKKKKAMEKAARIARYNRLQYNHLVENDIILKVDDYGAFTPEHKQKQCGICHDLLDGTRPVVMPQECDCGSGIFHDDCLGKWCITVGDNKDISEGNLVCPLCRGDMAGDVFDP